MMLPMIGSRNQRPQSAVTGDWRPSRSYMFLISYPIRILQPDQVEVLLRSRELAEKYGEAPVAVRFRHGEGEVFHMISHYYLQRTELRTARHRASAATYAGAKGVALDAELAADLDGLAVGDVESAAASSRWLANVVADKKRRFKGE
jgi:hypothetical protein